VNIWPTNLTSMRVAYGDSNVLRCAVTLAYDRFFTQFEDLEGQVAFDTPNGVVNSNDQQFQPFPVKLESGQYTTTGTNSILPLGGV
ncbi:MAG: hypothetical protein VXY93_16865, partial [Pseudomonadota bacterium]|nr:hypothetical protein [Pseudomonadota bacterium]